MIRLRPTPAILFIAVGSAIALGCATTPSPPDWVLTGASGDFPRERFILGVGSGNDRDVAAQRARAEIARSFDVSVHDTVHDRVQTTVTEAAGARSESLVERIAIDTRTTSDGDFAGTEIVRIWIEPGGGPIWALAALERQASRDAWEARLSTLDAAIARHSRAARRALDPVPRARALGQAVRLAHERDRLTRRLAVVSYGALRPAHGTPELEARLADALAAVRVSLQSSASSPADGPAVAAALRDALSHSLTGIGLQVVDAAGPSDLRIECRIALGRIDRRRRPWPHVDWDGACDVEQGGALVVTSSDSGAESHPDAATARRKAWRRGEQALVAGVEADLLRFLERTD